jgi:hypothetical protein
MEGAHQRAQQMQLLRKQAAAADRAQREASRARVEKQRKELLAGQARLEEERRFCASCLRLRFRLNDDKRLCAECFKLASGVSADKRHGLRPVSPTRKPSPQTTPEKRVAAEEKVKHLTKDLVLASSTKERVRALWKSDQERHALASKPPRLQSSARKIEGAKEKEPLKGGLRC